VDTIGRATAVPLKYGGAGVTGVEGIEGPGIESPGASAALVAYASVICRAVVGTTPSSSSGIRCPCCARNTAHLALIGVQ
jgi:hypothetical protein